MARKHRRRRGTHVSESIVSLTRTVELEGTAAASEATTVTAVAIPQAVTPPEETVNRKILRISGQLMFAASLPADNHLYAVFCMLAHPLSEGATGFPSIEEWDPFNDGPGKTGYAGESSPRPFGRRRLVLNTPPSSSADVSAIFEPMDYRTKAKRLLRPGWALSAGVYVKGDTVKWRLDGVLGVVIAG